jgi:GH25 family lysozyme M1 (1,4-beta-N-acetylmuramidase)
MELPHNTQGQQRYYYCGPAAVRCALSCLGQTPSQDSLAAELGTTENGTDSSADVVRVLSAHLGPGTYDDRYIPGQDATPDQTARLRADLLASIDAGRALVANVRGTITTVDGTSYTYNGGHYVAVVGYRAGGDEALVADVALPRDYWTTTARLATWIATRGYSYPAITAPVGADAPGPLFGWDASDFDWSRGPMDLAAAKADGISWFTHKATEATSTKHTHLRDALERARAAGIEFLGAYHVVRSSPSVQAQVDYFLRYLDEQVPWWRTFPGFMLQVDLELWPYDQVSAATGIAFARALQAAQPKRVLTYASHGMYDNSLAGLNTPLWNANYGANPARGFRAAYPGDAGAGWTPYSGQTPVMWQYGSQLTIGSQPGCDANAFRGSLADLRLLITGSAGQGAPSIEEDEEMKGILAETTGEQSNSQVRAWIDPVLGPVYDNLISGDYAPAWIAMGFAVPPGGGYFMFKHLAELGRDFGAAQREYLAALEAGSGGTGGGSVKVSAESVAAIADATADTLVADPERDGASN